MQILPDCLPKQHHCYPTLRFIFLNMERWGLVSCVRRFKLVTLSGVLLIHELLIWMPECRMDLGIDETFYKCVIRRSITVNLAVRKTQNLNQITISARRDTDELFAVTFLRWGWVTHDFALLVVQQRERTAFRNHNFPSRVVPWLLSLNGKKTKQFTTQQGKTQTSNCCGLNAKHASYGGGGGGIQVERCRWISSHLADGANFIMIIMGCVFMRCSFFFCSALVLVLVQRSSLLKEVFFFSIYHFWTIVIYATTYI